MEFDDFVDPPMLSSRSSGQQLAVNAKGKPKSKAMASKPITIDIDCGDVAGVLFSIFILIIVNNCER